MHVDLVTAGMCSKLAAAWPYYQRTFNCMVQQVWLNKKC
jgi:hypothetical protein